MAIPAYNQTLDTMVSTALDTYSRDPVNCFTDMGEKFLKGAAQRGRIFMVNDAENVRHPIMYDHGEDNSLYIPDDLDGSPIINNLSASATEILTHALFTLLAGTRNINMPQSQPPGNLIDYVGAVVKANMMSILDQEERSFTQGILADGVPQLRAPFSADSDYSAGRPMSLGSLIYSSSSPCPQADGDSTDESFANVKVDDIPKWETYKVNADGTQTYTSDTGNHSAFISTLQKAILKTSYSPIERPTDVMTSLDTFEVMLALLRASGALPDPVRANLGKEGVIPFGGVNIDWHRHLDAEVTWDVNGTEATTATYPVFGINWNSLRFNTVRAGGVGSESLGFIRQIGGMQPHPLKTNVFKRIEWKRQWSVDNGRRSFFSIAGMTSLATA